MIFKLPITIWRPDDAPDSLTVDLPNYNKVQWVALIPPHYREDDLGWLEAGTPYARSVLDFEGPEGALLRVGYL